MATRSAVARWKGNGRFSGVYIHWDGYPSGVGRELFNVCRGKFDGDIGRFLRFMIDNQLGGWSAICGADWDKDPEPRPDSNKEICSICQRASWQHYAQYYGPSVYPSEYWKQAGRPPKPETVPANAVLVFGHSCKPYEIQRGPEAYSGNDGLIDQNNAAGCGCEWVYAFDEQAGTMRVLSSVRQNGDKMIGFFGAGDPLAEWVTVATIELNGDEPDWEAIQNQPELVEA